MQLSRYQTYHYQLSTYAPRTSSCGANGFTWLQSASAVRTHPLRWDRHISPTCLIARYGSFHLYFRGHNKTHDHCRSTTHLIAPHEGPDQGFDHLFPYRVDVECRHVGVYDHSEGDSGKLPSRIGFCVHLSTMKPNSLCIMMDLIETPVAISTLHAPLLIRDHLPSPLPDDSVEDDSIHTQMPLHSDF